MNKKITSTIGAKPDIQKGLEQWISGSDGGGNPSHSEPAVQPASQLSSQPASLEATKMLSVRIPAGLHQKLRIHSVSEDLQIQDIVINLLSRYLDERKAAV